VTGEGTLPDATERARAVGPDRPVRVWLDHLAEVLVAAVLICAGLLYSSHLSDNFLAKGGVVLILGPAAFAAWAGARLLDGSVHWVRANLYLPFGAYLAAQVLSLSLSDNPGRGLEVTAQAASGLLLLVVALHLGRDPRRRARLVTLVLALGLVVGVVGMLQYMGVAAIGLPARFRGLPVATLGNTNFVAHFLDLVLPLALALAIGYRGQWLGRVALAALAVTGFHLVLTSSRGGWLSTLVGAGAVVALCAPRRRWGSRLVLGLVILALLSPVAGFVLESIHVGDGQTLYDRAADLAEQTAERTRTAFEATDFSRAMRVLIWQDTAELIGANPWVGVGPGGFGLHLPANRTTVGHRAWKELMGRRQIVAYHAHNEYLEAWAESGIAGLVTLIWLLAAALWTAWRTALAARRRGDPSVAPFRGDAFLALGCAGALTAAAVHALFSFNLQDSFAGSVLWVLLGLGVAVGASATAGPVTRLDLSPLSRRAPAVLILVVAALGGAYLGVCILVGDAYYLRGLEHLGQGHPNRALLSFRQAVAWRGRDFRHHHTLGKTALDLGRIDEAEAALTEALARHPHSPQALRLMGQALLRRPASAPSAGDSSAASRAVTALRRAVRVDPLEADNYTLLAGALAAAGDRAGAIQARRQALAFRPEDARLMMSLGIAYREAGQLEEAVAVLERARSLSRRDGVIAGNLGAVHLLLGDLPKAEEHLRIALRLDADNQVAWRTNLAQALMRQGRLTEALAEAHRAAAEAPGDGSVQALTERLRQLVEGDSDE